MITGLLAWAIVGNVGLLALLVIAPWMHGPHDNNFAVGASAPRTKETPVGGPRGLVGE
jgi:hypothetical protein